MSFFAGDLLDRAYCFSFFSGGLLVIIYEKDMFDYHGGEPHPSMLTVLRALEVCCLHAFHCFNY
jgi:hypothetical protein